MTSYLSKEYFREMVVVEARLLQIKEKTRQQVFRIQIAKKFNEKFFLLKLQDIIGL